VLSQRGPDDTGWIQRSTRTKNFMRGGRREISDRVGDFNEQHRVMRLCQEPKIVDHTENAGRLLLRRQLFERKFWGCK
jgi:hypothetical protein